MELREIITALHLAAVQPHAIIIDGLHLLRSGVTDSPSPHGAVQPPSRTQQSSPSQPSPASHREAQRNERMQLACLIALAAQAADTLPRARVRIDMALQGPADAEVQQPPPPSPLCELCVGGLERLFETEVSSRWLSDEVTVGKLQPSGQEYSIRCRRQGGAEGPATAFGVVDRRLVVHGAGIFEPAGVATWGNGYSPPPKGLASQHLAMTVGGDCGRQHGQQHRVNNFANPSSL